MSRSTLLRVAYASIPGALPPPQAFNVRLRDAVEPADKARGVPAACRTPKPRASSRKFDLPLLPKFRESAFARGVPPLTRTHRISGRASRFHLPPALRWRAPFGVRRFDPAGWAAATVAAVAAVAAAAALPTPSPPQSRRGAAPARAHTHPFLAGIGVQVDRAGGRAAGASSGAARGVSGAPVRLSVPSRPVARPSGPVLPISQSRTISYIHLLGWGVTASPGVD